MSRIQETYLKQFDADEFQGLHDKFKMDIQDIAGKDVVLFVGATGAGKSTTINFFLGNAMEKNDDELKARYDVKKNVKECRLPGIGHGQSSHTLLPGAYSLTDYNITLLDTAGFGDTRGINVELCIALALKYISSVATVKGIVVVLNVESILESRSSHMLQLVKFVSKLTHEFEEKKMAFCVTHLDAYQNYSDEKIKEALITKANNLAKTIDNTVHQDDSNEDKITADFAARVLRLINSDNLFLMKSLEQPEHQKKLRELFFSYVQTMPGLRNALSVALSETSYEKLINWTNEKSSLGVSLLGEISELSRAESTLVATEKKISQLKNRLLEAVKNLSRLVEQKNTTSQRIDELCAEKDKLEVYGQQEIEREFLRSIPLFPTNKSSIHGSISTKLVIPKKPHFKQIDYLLGATVESENDSTITIRLRVPENKQQEDRLFQSGVRIYYLQKNLPEYKDAFAAIVKELAALRNQENTVARSEEQAIQAVNDMQSDILMQSETLGLNLREGDDVDLMVRSLNKKGDELNVDIANIVMKKEKLEDKFKADKKVYDMLYEVVSHLDELQNKNNIKQFVTLFKEYGYAQLSHQRQSQTVVNIHGFFQHSATAAASSELNDAISLNRDRNRLLSHF